ncbi:MAG: hypothetical protein E7638_07775, partial [Ruminococcaceae bacterium]|nr:hypothetical protein [Oscillospiraceae bacterium]
PMGCHLVIPEKYRISAELSEKLGIAPERAGVIVGECHGIIGTEEKGEGGFGYDNLFFYPDLGKTFAEMDGDEKNSVSHRGIAMRELANLLMGLING